MTELTDGVTQDESREPEDCQQLKRQKEKYIQFIYMKHIFVTKRAKSYKDVEERGMVVIVQNLFFQLCLYTAVHLKTNNKDPQRQK